MKKIFFILFFLSFGLCAKSSYNCDVSVPTGTLAACYEKIFKLEDQELNEVYNKLKLTLSLNDYDGLSKETYWAGIVQSQRYWIKLRDAQCKAKGAFFEHGSLAENIEVNKCLLNATKERNIFFNDEVKFINELP